MKVRKRHLAIMDVAKSLPYSRRRWLCEVDKFALQNSLKALETAYKNFFTDLKPKAKRRFDFPSLKEAWS